MMGRLTIRQNARMESLASTAGPALHRLLADQPTTQAKVTFAWRMAAGPSLARATAVRWQESGTVVVRTDSDAWRREVRLARPILLERLGEWLGPDTVRKLEIE